MLILGLGSNMPGLAGEAKAQLVWAVSELRTRWGSLQVAPCYRTSPISSIAQPDFLNTVVAITFSEPPSPLDILAELQALEAKAGRRPGERWGPRPLDVDILLWGDRCIKSPKLTVPHPRLRDRRFVLAPLADLLPDLPVPPDGRTVRDLLAALDDDAGQYVERVPWVDSGPAK